MSVPQAQFIIYVAMYNVLFTWNVFCSISLLPSNLGTILAMTKKCFPAPDSPPPVAGPQSYGFIIELKCFSAFDKVRHSWYATEHSVSYLSKTTPYGPTCTSIFLVHPLLGYSYNHIPTGTVIYSIHLDTESTITPIVNAFPLLQFTDHHLAERNSAASLTPFRVRG
jgi:hypothetical protein